MLCPWPVSLSPLFMLARLLYPASISAQLLSLFVVFIGSDCCVPSISHQPLNHRIQRLIYGGQILILAYLVTLLSVSCMQKTIGVQVI